ncbi:MULTISPECIES: Eco29kI family restriction endonuclease [Stenotrophomonas]|uniref:Eco29kI family restriction endonuclease n=1 Tax=Stenotrophomonas TaxID=40323 RepID=UPI000C255F05|nr:Eco29kI family restriction endonuclease [Stenotrophomonas maltophilia]MBA0296087.1 Eco29kI family restriction endonuclease [Stenotrophomonas maltophilia]MBA0350237.1 Eco29kI family restriction endonuclease [Stenotrophomonas maltophilia]MBA0418173.1 Eco29kI family restriction endonuclease [Stenotrophomonas maltophilia]MBH1373606.1 Eco29kI family restriction endonuclease [Stenotrophomonas maltophilia]MBH1751583.1 Eco29kI family restriction endonuclease [Stenotrophomonas maltophilia]
MTAKVIPFNPLDKKNLGASVAEALLTKEVHPLGELSPFDGAGIYAIYYTGDFEAYEQIARLNNDGKFMLPIYVGKAVPAGARMGAGSDVPPGKVLFKRLKEHADSIKAATNLSIEDFFCRFLVVDDIWIPLGESLIISRFTPVWNSLIDGFGNHNPGKGRHAGMRPRWDVLHPGREWAQRLAERPESPSRVAEDATTYLRILPACLSDKFIEAEGE